MKPSSNALMSSARQRAGGRPSRKSAFWTIIAVSLIATAAIVPMSIRAADVIVYKHPDCDCCTKWVQHLRQAGFEVDTVDTEDLVQLKRTLGVPRDLGSCHTAVAGEYLVEGHVPADLVRRLQQEKPPIRGLAVPFMPPGSPGMEHPNPVRYDVFAFDKDGKVSVYATRQGQRSAEMNAPPSSY